MLAGLATSPFSARTGEPLVGASEWFTSMITGDLAVILCVLALAFVGLMMLGGRIDARTGLRVVLGCFLLLGAPVIAATLMGLKSQGPVPSALVTSDSQLELGPREELPSTENDPYAGASRRD